MKIVFLIRSLDVGGTERQLVNLAAGLHQRGHSVFVIAFYGGGRFAEELASRGVVVLAAEKAGRWDVLGFVRALRQTLRSLAPDVLYSLLPVPNLVAAFVGMTLRRRPRLVWGVRSVSMDLSHYDRLTRLAYAAERRLSFLPDMIVANSSAAGKVARSRPIEVVPNGIDVGRFVIDREAGQSVRAELGIAVGAMLVGHVARLDPIKDHGTFLRAAARVAAHDRAVRFLVVGSGESDYARAIKGLATDLGIGDSITWVGERSDMPAVYNALDTLVSSSSSEGFPNVVAEAMACGVTCVVTDVGDCRTIVGDDALVVAAGDHESLAATIRRVLQTDRCLSAEERRRHIVSRFSIESMIVRTEARLLGLRGCHDRERNGRPG